MEGEPRRSGRCRTLRHSSLNEGKLAPDPVQDSSATGSARASAAANLTERHPNPKRRRPPDSVPQSTKDLKVSRARAQNVCTPELTELWQRAGFQRAAAQTNRAEKHGSSNRQPDGELQPCKRHRSFKEMEWNTKLDELRLIKHEFKLRTGELLQMDGEKTILRFMIAFSTVFNATRKK